MMLTSVLWIRITFWCGSGFDSGPWCGSWCGSIHTLDTVHTWDTWWLVSRTPSRGVVDTSVDPLWSAIRLSCWFLSPRCTLPPGCDFSLIFPFTALLWFSLAFLFLLFLSVWRISMLPGLWAFSWSVGASLQLLIRILIFIFDADHGS